MARDSRERRVIGIWRASNLREGTIAGYMRRVRQFRAYWCRRGVDEIERMTQADVTAFARTYVGSRWGRRLKEASRAGFRNALHAWSCALERLGEPVPKWSPPAVARTWPAWLHAYAEFRRAQRGIAARTLVMDVDLASDFIRFLRRRSRTTALIRVKDIDAFVERLSLRLSRRTVARLCTSLRSFLRFLHATGRIHRDLACCVVAPRFRLDEQPPRALPWETVRDMIRAIPRNQPLGRRDFAMFLLMAAYGLGAGEVVSLRLEDVDWRNNVIRSRRIKTAVALELPLLPAVARALAAYLRHGRPRHATAREIFVTKALPHRRVTTSVLRHRVRLYARQIGLVAARIGSHVFRHSHATRQIDSGANLKIVSDILGHRRPSSTSVYVRVAFQRLRSVALPVPR